MIDLKLIEILERAVAAGVTLDSDGTGLYASGAIPPALATLIESRRDGLVALLAAQRRIRAADCDPATA
ncbi:MAG: hypothetical protein K1Y01_07765 [Vicinamibacteria bacterium]|nr:hypothetical protein [Vicinamibacteria bacterium]